VLISVRNQKNAARRLLKMALLVGPSKVFAIGQGHTNRTLSIIPNALIFLGILLLMSLFDFPAKMGKGDKVSALLAIAGANFYFLCLYGLGCLSMVSSAAIHVQLIGWNASWLCHWLPFAMSSYGCHSYGSISDWFPFPIHLRFWLELLCQPNSRRCPLLDDFVSWWWMLEVLKEGWLLGGETVLLDTRIGLSHLRWPDGSLLLPCTRVLSRHSMMGMLALSWITQSPTFPLASILFKACEGVLASLYSLVFPTGSTNLFTIPYLIRVVLWEHGARV
jgi:hypothetical protein